MTRYWGAATPETQPCKVRARAVTWSCISPQPTNPTRGSPPKGRYGVKAWTRGQARGSGHPSMSSDESSNSTSILPLLIRCSLGTCSGYNCSGTSGSTVEAQVRASSRLRSRSAARTRGGNNKGLRERGEQSKDRAMVVLATGAMIAAQVRC